MPAESGIHAGTPSLVMQTAVGLVESLVIRRWLPPFGRRRACLPLALKFMLWKLTVAGLLGLIFGFVPSCDHPSIEENDDAKRDAPLELENPKARSSFGMDAERIRSIAQKPHNRNELIEQLNIYPNAREYEIVVRNGRPSEKLVESPKIKAKEKVVEGTYLVSEFQPPGAPSPFIMVVSYDAGSACFRKWLLTSDGTVAEWIGTSIPNTRTQSWVSTAQNGDGTNLIVSIESHSDTGTQWRELIVEDGKVAQVIEGTARKVK